MGIIKQSQVPESTGDAIQSEIVFNSAPVSVENPFPTDGDSVYTKDVLSTVPDVGAIFENLGTVDNVGPYSFYISFKRIVYASAIGIGCNDIAAGFGQSITVELLGSADEPRAIVQSTTGNVRSRLVEFTPAAFKALRITFNDNTQIKVTGLTIRKEIAVESHIQGRDVDGKVRNIQSSRLGSLHVRLEEYQGDAFGRLRVSEPYTEFDNSLTSPMADSFFWSELPVGVGTSGTYTRSTSSYTMNVPATNGTARVRSTKQRFKYQPGKSTMILITGVVAPEIGTRKRTGYVDFDNVGLGVITHQPQNGVFFEMDWPVGAPAPLISWNIVNNGIVTEKVFQAAWSEDVCDGNGSTEFTLNLFGTNIFYIDLEWLGVGAVRCGFANQRGELIKAHIFRHSSSTFIDVYMRTANLPISWSIESLGNAGSIKQICGTVISEGGFNPKGIFGTVTSPLTGSAILNGTFRTVLGIRLKPEYFEFSVEIDSIAILVPTNGDIQWELLFNPTITGTPVWTDVTDSAIQFSSSILPFTGQQRRITAGVISERSNSASPEIQNSLRIGKSLAGAMDTVWIVCYAIGQNETVHAVMNYRELI
jgi:hypothetical protein